MSARVKKNLTIYSILVFFAAVGLVLYFSTRESSSQNIDDEDGNIEDNAGEVTLISRTQVEDETRRNAWKREYTVEKVIEYVDPDTEETVRDTLHSKIVEVASGLNYYEDGEWKPSNPHFVDMGDHFELVESAYSVSVPKYLTGEMTYSVDGTPLTLQFKHIIISDGLNQVTLDVPNALVGSIDANDTSVIRFSNVWNGIDVEYHAGKGLFQQDIVIKDNDVLNAEGVDADEAIVYFYTKIDPYEYVENDIDITLDGDVVDVDSGLFNSTSPDKSNEIVFAPGEGGKPLHILGVSPVLDADGNEVTCAKRQLYKDWSSGSLYFVESTELSSLENGHVLDYNMINGTINEDTVWTADETYYVSSDINLSADLVIEPGTVIKFNDDSAINVNTDGKILAVGEPYRYIVFTSKNDDDSGETIDGSSGSPNNLDYDEAINLTSNAETTSRISYCKIGYASKGILCFKTLSSGAKIEHNIFCKCNIGIYLYGSTITSVRNNLMTYCGSGIVASFNATTNLIIISNNTIDNCVGPGMCFSGTSDEDLQAYIWDNILSANMEGIVKYGTPRLSLDYNAYYNNEEGDVYGVNKGNHAIDDSDFTSTPYDSSTIGSYYINDTANAGALLRNAGSRTVYYAGLNGDEFTINKPTPVSGTIGYDPDWSKISSDTGTVDIGYHHNRIDYVLTANVTGYDYTTNFDFTINPGVVVAHSGSLRKLSIESKCKLLCNGEADDPILFSHSNLVSMSVKTPTDTYDLQRGVWIWTNSAYGGPEISNTIFQGFQYGLSYSKNLYENNINGVVFRNNLTGLWCKQYGPEQIFNNCLFYYNDKGIYFDAPNYDTELSREFYNMTFYKNIIGLQMKPNDSDPTRTVKIYDSLFVDNEKGIKREDNLGTLDEQYNAYRDNGVNIEDSSGGLIGIGNNSMVLVDSPFDDTWETNWDWDDRWYLVQDAGTDENDITLCVDGGSRTVSSAGLSLFTTRNDSDIWLDVGQVDIGYHYDPDYGDDITSTTVTNIYFNGTTEVTISVVFQVNENWTITIYDLSMTQVYTKSSQTAGDISSEMWDGGSEDGGTYIVKISSQDNPESFTPFYFYIHLDKDNPSVEVKWPTDGATVIGY